MKNLWILVLLLVSLSACSSAGSGYENCSRNGDVCIWMQVKEPILYGEANTVTITVSSNIDIDNLGIYLSSWPQILIEDTNGWSDHGVNWVINIEANQPQAFTRHILLPEYNGHFNVVANASTPQERATHYFIIFQKNGVSTIYYKGTPIPNTPGLMSTLSPAEVQTLQAMPTITLFPTLTPLPTKTSTPTPYIYPPPPTIPPGDWPATAYP